MAFWHLSVRFDVVYIGIVLDCFSIGILFIGKLLSDQKFPGELRVRLLKVLAVAALKDDVILILHQDRREHVFMNYANNFERLPLEEQKSLALFVSSKFVQKLMKNLLSFVRRGSPKDVMRIFSPNILKD